MKNVSYYNDDGEIVGTIFASEEEIEMNCPTGCKWIDGVWSDELYWVKDGAATPYTAEQLASVQNRPGWGYTWSNKLMMWVGAKTAAERYQEAVNAPVTYRGMVFQADPASLAALRDALITATLIDGYAVDWRLANNQWTRLDADDLKELVKMIAERNQSAFRDRY